MNNRLLVTGATGFIGSALCKRLVDTAYTLRVLQRAPLEGSEAFGADGIEQVAGTLLDATSLHEACDSVDTVVHVAGVAHVSAADTDEAERVIVDGTRNLLAAALACKVRRFVYVSSSLAQAIDENSGDITAYGWYKREAEVLLLEAQARGEIEVVILRPVNVYGPGMKGNIATMIAQIIRHRLPPLPVLYTRLSLVGVDDVVQALLLAIESPRATGKIYTVTDGQEYRVSDIEAAIYATLGKRFPRWRTPRVVLFAAAFAAGAFSWITRQGGAIGLRTWRNITTDNVFDNEAICRELGFSPRTTFYQELPRIIQDIVAKKSQKDD